jgi:hypothetical protein
MTSRHRHGKQGSLIETGRVEQGKAEMGEKKKIHGVHEVDNEV